jgi:predicted MFS family arabinose efflux permease
VRMRFDIAGALTLAVGITGVLFGMNRGAAWGWTHPLVIAGFVIGPVFIALFVRVERRAQAPLIPLHYLRRRNVAGPIAVQGLTNFAYMGAFVLMPLLLERSLGFTTTHVTLLVIARPLALSLTGPVAGYLTLRTGERAAGVLGTLLVASSMVVFSTIGMDTADAVIVAGLVLCGMGMGVSSPAMAASIANSVDEGDFGVAGATQQLVTQVCVAAGIQLMQTIQASVAAPGASGQALAESYSPAFLIGGAVCLLGLFGAWIIRPTVGRGAVVA